MARGVTSLPGSSTGTARQVMNRLVTHETRLASAVSGQGASLVGVEDSAGHFTGTTVEAALVELAAGVGITDVVAAAATELTIAAGVVTATQTFHTIDTEADAASDDLDTVNGLANGQFYIFQNVNAARNVVVKHGTGNIINPSGRDITLDVTNDKIFGFSNGTSLFVLDMSLATPANGGLASALAAVTASQGASLIGIEDSGARITATNVEGALSEIMNELDNYRDQLVTATITVPSTGGGGTDAALTMSLRQARDNATSPTTICQVMIFATSQQYQPNSPNVNTVTFSAATVGSIVATGTSWALVATDATGAFACTVSDSADETVWFRVLTPEGVSDLGQRCMVVACVPDSAVWSA